MSNLVLERIAVGKMPDHKYWKLFFDGQKSSKKFYCLHDGDDLVMSDAPLEVEIAERMAAQLSGHVLILGAGIGLLNSKIKPDQCASVTVVDIDESTFEYAKRYLKGMKYQPYREVVADANNREQMAMLDGYPFDFIVSDLYSDRAESKQAYQDLLAVSGKFLRWSFT